MIAINTTTITPDISAQPLPSSTTNSTGMESKPPILIPANPPLTADTFQSNPKETAKKQLAKIVAPVQKAIDSIDKTGGKPLAVNYANSGKGTLSTGFLLATFPLWDLPPYLLLPWIIRKDNQFFKARKKGLIAPPNTITVSYERHLTRKGALANVTKRLKRLETLLHRQGGRPSHPVYVPFLVNQGQSKYVSLALIHPGDWKHAGRHLLAESQKQLHQRLRP